MTRWAGRGGIKPSRQDVDDLITPLVARIEQLESEVERLRADAGRRGSDR